MMLGKTGPRTEKIHGGHTFFGMKTEENTKKHLKKGATGKTEERTGANMRKQGKTQ